MRGKGASLAEEQAVASMARLLLLPQHREFPLPRWQLVKFLLQQVVSQQKPSMAQKTVTISLRQYCGEIAGSSAKGQGQISALIATTRTSDSNFSRGAGRETVAAAAGGVAVAATAAVMSSSGLLSMDDFYRHNQHK